MPRKPIEHSADQRESAGQKRDCRHVFENACYFSPLHWPSPTTQMMRVDLRLAVNYLPACVCMAKLLAFMLAVSVIPPGHEVRVYTVLAAVLYLDRLWTANIIFDANAVLLAVYFSHIHAMIRSGSETESYTLPVMALHLGWMVSCGVLLFEPAAVRRILERRYTLERLGPTAAMLVILVALSFLHQDPEHIAVQSWRAVSFALLSFAWVYVVGLDSMQGSDHLKQNSYQFTTRMAPLLYSPFWATAVYFQAAALCLCVQFLRRYNPQLLSTYQPVHAQSPYPEPDPSPPGEPDEGQNLEELFRQARLKSAAAAQV